LHGGIVLRRLAFALLFVCALQTLELRLVAVGADGAVEAAWTVLAAERSDKCAELQTNKQTNNQPAALMAAAPRAHRYVNISTGDLDLHFFKSCPSVPPGATTRVCVRH
jgi:hypothetical protein